MSSIDRWPKEEIEELREIEAMFDEAERRQKLRKDTSPLPAYFGKKPRGPVPRTRRFNSAVEES